MSFLFFPDELMELVISFSSVHDTVRLGMTCRRLRALCDSRQMWMRKLQRLDIDTAPDTPPSTSVDALTMKELKRKVVDATLRALAWRRRFGLQLTLKDEIHFHSEARDYPVTARLVPGRNEMLLVNESHIELWSTDSKQCIWSARSTIAPVPVDDAPSSMECVFFDFDMQVSDGRLSLVIATEYSSTLLAMRELRIFRYDTVERRGELVFEKPLPQVLDLELTIRGNILLARFTRMHKIALIDWKRGHSAAYVEVMNSEMKSLNRRFRAATLSDDGRHLVGIVMYNRRLSVLTFPTSSCFTSLPEARLQNDWNNVLLAIDSLPVLPLTHHDLLPAAVGEEGPLLLNIHLFKPTWKPDSPTELFIITYERSPLREDKALTSFRVQLSASPPQPASRSPPGVVEQSLIPSVVEATRTTTSQIPWDPYCITNSGRLFCVRDALRCFSTLDPSHQPIKKFAIADHPWMDGQDVGTEAPGVVSLDPIVTSVDPWSETIVVMARGIVRLYRIE